MRQRALGLAVAIIGCFALISASGAAATTSVQRVISTPKVTKITVSSRAAVVHYLRSIHVSAKGIVVQRGLHNYAGAHCPGADWACASTRHTVVQIAKEGGQNRFVCKSSKCVVVQLSGVLNGVYVSGRQFGLASKPPGSGGNSGVCVKTGSGATTGTGQSCLISQTGSGLNTAVVYENTNKVSGLVQTAQYSAQISQTHTGSGSNVGNKACVYQNINLDGSASNTNTKGTTVNLQAYQNVVIKQDSFAGANSAQYSANSTGACTTDTLSQAQTLSSTVTTNGSITQYENQPSNGANVNIDIEQNRSQGYMCTTVNNALQCPSSANNTANFVQTMNQTAVANSLKSQRVEQVQSSPDDNPPFSGLVGAINQDTSSTGQSIANATQNETQCEDAAVSGLTGCLPTPDDVPFALSQTQYGPEGIFKSTKAPKGRVPFAHKTPGDSAQTGGHDNVFNVIQTSHQNTDNGSTVKNTIAGGITTSGSGTVTQNAVIQGLGTIDVQDGTNGSVTGTIDCPTGKGSCTKTLSAPKITGQPDNPTFNGQGNPFTFKNADPTVTFLCSVDGADYGSCTSVNNPDITNTNPPYPPTTGSETTSGLAPGTHTFSVETQDPANPNGPTPAAATITWKILPISIYAFGSDGLTNGVAVGTDGSSAGWKCKPGGPITLQVGTDPGTYAVISIDNAPGISIDGMSPPSFSADNWQAGSPRLFIRLSNGHQLIGYPGISGLNGTGMAWSDSAIDGGNTYNHSWSDVQTFESGAGTTVSEAFVVADASQWIDQIVPNYGPDNISDLTFQGVDFNSATCSS